MDRHEKKEHPGFVPSMPIDESDEKGEDGIWNYHMSRFQIGLYFLNLEDAIKHGDGYRLLRCFKFALLFEYKHRHTKYAYLLLHFLSNSMLFYPRTRVSVYSTTVLSIMSEEWGTTFHFICTRSI